MTALPCFVPGDSATKALGADEVAAALQAQATVHNQPVRLVRNGARGLFWLEPLREVVTPPGRVAYGPVSADDWPALWPALQADAAGQAVQHPLRLGITDLLPYLVLQERLTLRRIGITDPLSLADYAGPGGWAGRRAALALTPAASLHEVLHSGLRGRGGAAFPAGIKWRTVADTAAPGEAAPGEAAQKYVVCNADEGDSGSFADRMVMEATPRC